MVSLLGTNAGGHLGWITKRCVICNRRLIVGKDKIYHCPKCVKLGIQAYFCEADGKVLHGKCPYCGNELVPLL
ncbi:MAG: hypothetical protein DRO18_00245 [Thermoprotei archaeon]|nr:MAG: hypothetical protein DRO18_00245 [Thermoprotei archaeon]HDN75530.1 hypothetical protein [Acidilobales archaeon]